MELLTSIGNVVEFGLALAAALAVGYKILPLAELFFTENLPEDATTEA